VVETRHLVPSSIASRRRAGKSIIAEVTKLSPLTPLVFFTATSQLVDVALVESICGVRVGRIIWATLKKFQKRGVQIDLACCSQYGTVAKKVVGAVMAKRDKKFIVYTDFTPDVESIVQSLRA